MDEPKKKNHAQTILYIVIFAVIYGGISYVVKNVMRPKAEAGAIQQANERMSKEIETAKNEATKDKSASEILQEKSMQKMNEKLDSASSPQKKKSQAAAMFLGAYILNTQARPDFCRSLGVPINSFAAAYRNQHADLFPIAKASIEEMLKESGTQRSLNDYIQAMSPSLNQAVAQDMKDLSSNWKMTEKETCAILESMAQQFVGQMDLHKIMPKVAETLTGH